MALHWGSVAYADLPQTIKDNHAYLYDGSAIPEITCTQTDGDWFAANYSWEEGKQYTVA